MNRYVCLLRGVNVGGKNKISMTDLKARLSEAGFSEVGTYINSGNILLSTNQGASDAAETIENLISDGFKPEVDRIKAIVLDQDSLRQITERAPEGFGSRPGTYHCDVLFPMDGTLSSDIMKAVSINPEIDKAWEENGVVYFQRLSALRTKSRLSRIIGSPIYKSLTIRSWNTTVKLNQLLNG